MEFTVKIQSNNWGKRNRLIARQRALSGGEMIWEGEVLKEIEEFFR